MQLYGAFNSCENTVFREKSCITGQPTNVSVPHLPLCLSLLRSKTATLTDHRIRLMNEVVSGIRIIKMYAWEKPFSALVDEVRR